MTNRDIRNQYFNWLSDLVYESGYSKTLSYKKLLIHLHSTEFRSLLPMDENRAEAGKNLRWRFVLNTDYDPADYDRILGDLDEPCSVLELMVAIAIHMEEDIMDDPTVGDRTSQWFWGMVVNLGLGSMSDDRFDKRYFEDAMETFLNREYEPDGRGGLFTIRDCERDLRDVEIFHQVCWYINTFS